MPFESTTCQCGSGVWGGTKSSESVSVLLPFCVVCVTKPLFAFAPWNGPLLWLSWAKLLVAAMISAVRDASMVLYIIRFGFGFFCRWVFYDCAFTRFVATASKSLHVGGLDWLSRWAVRAKIRESRNASDANYSGRDQHACSASFRLIRSFVSE